MFGRTHGQHAKLQSFGKRIFTWHQRLQLSMDELARAKELIRYTKLSGAVGNYQGLSPLEEAKALELLGLKPFVGATQIMPREVFQPLVNALVELVGSLTQIAEDFRLAARSGNTLMQEPFGKQQMGSSAMPQKKNTIKTENQMGMYSMAKGFAFMLRDRMITWEERAIEQSCVERVAWPDLFQVVIQSFKNLFKVLDQEKIQIFVDNMLEEIKLSGGCYAAEEAKEFLKHHCAKHGLPYEQAYRMVQLAAFMIHMPSEARKAMRDNPPKSLDEAQEMLKSLQIDLDRDSIQMIICDAQLEPLAELKPDSLSDEQWEQRVEDWNQILLRVFSTQEIKQGWENLFTITYQLKGEDYLFEQLAA
jgi:adenylosuccinate lyase